MKNKGFTLIELLGVIVILALLMIIVMPKIINSLKSSSEKVDDLILEMIYNASELYIDAYQDDFITTNGNKYCITLKDLIGEGYLKSPINVNDTDITNLKSVQVTYNDGFTFELKDNDECEVNYCESKGVCQIIELATGSSHGVYSVGDKVKCGTENFYIIESTTNTVTMLAEKNIEITKDNPVQSDNAGTINFSNTEYDNTTGNVNAYWYARTSGVYTVYPLYVYDNKSNLYPYVEAYETYLKSIGICNVDASIPSIEQIKDLGCTWEEGYGTIDVCRWYGDTDWRYSTNYWTGSVGNPEYIDGEPFNSKYGSGADSIWVVEKKTHGGTAWAFGVIYNSGHKKISFGIRPVITIDKSQIAS